MPINQAGCQTCVSDTAPCAVTPQNPFTANGLGGTSMGGFSAGSYCNPSGTGALATQQMVFPNGGQYFVKDYLQPGFQYSMPLYSQYLESYKTIARLLFDYDEVIDPAKATTKPVQRLTFKAFPNLQLMESFDGYSYIRQERRRDDTRVFIARDETVATNQVLVGDESGQPIGVQGCDPRYKDMFEPGATILVKAIDPTAANANANPVCCATDVQRTIIAVDTTTWNAKTYLRLTLEGTGAANQLPLVTAKGANVAPNTVIAKLNKDGIAYPGDEVMVLYSGRNDCEFVTTGYTQQPLWTKQSFIQHVSFEDTINQAELNRSFMDKEGLQGYLKQKMQGLTYKMMNTIAYTFYRGRNRNPLNGYGYTDKHGNSRANLPGETMGLIPTIYDAHIRKPSLGIIKSAARLVNDDEKVRMILEQLLQVQNSGGFSQGQAVTMLMDYAALTAFMKMNNAWNKFTGFMVTRTDNVTKDFTIPTIMTPNGPTEVMACEALSKLTGNNGTIIFLPKHLIGLRSVLNYKISDYATMGIEKNTQGFMFKDITMPNQLECRTFNIRTKFAIVIGLADTGAFRMIEWLK